MSFFRHRRYSDIHVSISEHISETVDELMEAAWAAKRLNSPRAALSETPRGLKNAAVKSGSGRKSRASGPT